MSLPKPFYEDTRAGIVIYNADCRDILPHLPKVDLVLTDPPYGVNFKGKETKHTKSSGGYISGDSDIGPNVVSLALEKTTRCIVFPGNRLLHSYPAPADIGCIFCPSGAGRGPWGFTCFNPILFYGKRPGGPTSPSSMKSFHTSDDVGHPCPKPMEWLSWLVSIGSRVNETVLDPFMGSGTTLRAAKDLGRKAIGIEIEEKYCEIAAKRLAQEVLF